MDPVTIYSSVSKGFSPPTTAELTPSGSAINLTLEPETGTNYDLGIKAGLPNGLYADINAFLFSLENTIVTRRDAGGGDFFVNAGKTRQRGIETYISYPLWRNSKMMKRSLVWLSHTWHHFRYKEFKQLTNDFSGKQLPATGPHTISAGFDISMDNGFFGNTTYYYSDKIALNDANSEFADAYHLWGARVGYDRHLQENWRLQLSVGAENLLDQKYSLGNDINGFGGRYYNAAAERNFYVSVTVQWDHK